MTDTVTNYVTWEVDGVWLVSGVEQDIIAQGRTQAHAIQRFTCTWRAEAEHTVTVHGTVFQGIGAAPAAIKAKYDTAAATHIGALTYTEA